MKIGQKKKQVSICGKSYFIKRNADGIPTFWCNDIAEYCRVIGFLHAHDRMMQMMLLRVIAQGRLCELLKDSQENLEVDIFIRETGFARRAQKEASELSAETAAPLVSYSEGINDYLNRYGSPFEFRLVGYKPEPWSPADTLLSAKVMSYAGLAQTQQDIEKLIIQAINGGVDLAKLKDLFSPHLDGLDEETIELIRKVRIEKELVPKSVRFLSGLPKIMASNNWMLAPSKSQSGHVIQCNDPHLECNRLPGVWYEYTCHIGEKTCMGVNIPGIPGLTMGRVDSVGWGFTYGFMDMIDFFIEDVRNGEFRESESYQPFTVRKEVIKRKKSPDVSFEIYENKRGILEKDPRNELTDGLYLTRAWAGNQKEAGDSIRSNFKLLEATDAFEAQELVQHITTSCNWIIGDNKGNIVYQQSGILPKRAHSGLHPVKGWEPELNWQGLHGPEALGSERNPECGFLCSANEDRNQPGKPLSINMPMGNYRVRRIESLLSQKRNFDTEDMKTIQSDLYSIQAESFLNLVKVHLDKLSTPAADALRNWDLQYRADSIGATVFEDFYHSLLRRLFGGQLFGLEAWDALISETGILVDFYHVFDRVLLEVDAKDPIWFHDRSKDDYISDALSETLAKPLSNFKPWAKTREVLIKNIFFGGALPRFLGIDKGPIGIQGGRSTICQGAVYRSHGRDTTFCPSYRFISDLSEGFAQTILAGGPSDRPYSRYYASELKRWSHFEYKTIQP